MGLTLPPKTVSLARSPSEKDGRRVVGGIMGLVQ